MSLKCQGKALRALKTGRRTVFRPDPSNHIAKKTLTALMGPQRRCVFQQPARMGVPTMAHKATITIGKQILI